MPSSYDDSLALALVVLGAFWLLYAIAAVGYELRDTTENLRFTSASLLLGDAVLTSAAGWLMLDESGHADAATGWVIGVALVHVGLGAVTLRGRISREISLLLLAVGIGLSAIGAALALDGPALVAAWSVEAVLMAWLARRMKRDRGYIAAVGFLAAASAHVLLFDARPDQLIESPEWSAVVALVLVSAAAATVSRLYRGTWDEFTDALDLLALAGLAYVVPIALEGVPVVVAWAVLAVALAFLTKRGLVELGGIAPALFVGLAAAHTLADRGAAECRPPRRRRRPRQRVPRRRGHDDRRVRRGAPFTGPARQAAHARPAPSARSTRLRS